MSTPTDSTAQASPPARMPVKVWDLFTRLFHWLLVVALGLAWLSGEQGNFTVHFIAGHVVIGLILFRLVWGVVGSETARFSNFVKGPGAILGYLGRMVSKTPDRALGHNPVGAVMVVLLLAVVTVQAVSGLFASENTWAFVSGPLAFLISSDLSETITSLHKGILFDILLVLAGVHVAAAFGYLIVKRENLIRPMVIGRKMLPPEDASAPPRMASPLLGAVVAAVAGLAAWGLYSLM